MIVSNSSSFRTGLISPSIESLATPITIIALFAISLSLILYRRCFYAKPDHFHANELSLKSQVKDPSVSGNELPKKVSFKQDVSFKERSSQSTDNATLDNVDWQALACFGVTKPPPDLNSLTNSDDRFQASSPNFAAAQTLLTSLGVIPIRSSHIGTKS
ncbi:MAG: hypothetical protein HZB76_05535 [Chlamydiae bacterium]|nr:hypothetical protein [Chlamydiota bacterium]